MDDQKAETFFGLGKALVTATSVGSTNTAECFSSAFNHFYRTANTRKAIEIATCPVPLAVGISDRTSLDMLEKSLDLVGPKTLEAGWVRTRYGLAVGLMMGDYTEATEHLSLAIDISEQLEDDGLRLRASSNLAAVDWFYLNWDSVVNSSTVALGLAKKISDPIAEWNAYIWALNSLVASGDIEAAQRVSETAVGASEQLRNRDEIALAHALCARPWEVSGQWNRARDHLSKSLELSPTETQALSGFALMEFQLGNIDEGKKHLADLATLAEATPKGPNLPWSQLGLTYLLAYRLTGEESMKNAGVDAVSSLIGTGGSLFVELMARIALSLANATNNNKETIEEHLPVIERLTGKMILAESIDRICGYIRFKSGDYLAAVDCFEKATEFTRQAGASVQLAWTLSDYADVKHALGGGNNEEAARSMLNEALVISRDLELQTVMETILARREILKA